jgi:thermostable 8-oxoguanine DNA glycosylase
MEKMKYTREIHDYCTCQKSDLHTQFCRTTLLKNNSANMGLKLYNKLSNTIKRLDKMQEFKRKLKYFLMQHTFYSVDEYMLPIGTTVT